MRATALRCRILSVGGARCIWCGATDPDPVSEHVFPAALGCPDDFCLTGGEVCTTCNHGLAHLDQSVIDDLDVMAFVRGVHRRGGKPPQFTNRRNVRGEVKDGEPILYINAESHSVNLGDGRTLPGYRGSGRDVQVSFTVDRSSGTARVSLSTSIGTSPTFVRGLHKIAFECLAFHRGHEACLSQRYDEVRRFVRAKRRGHRSLHRRVLMLAGSDEPFRFQSWLPVGPEGGLPEVVPFRLGGPEFVVDLSPGQIHLPRLVAECERQLGDRTWWLLPLPRR